jgi:hypothetical protein
MLKHTVIAEGRDINYSYVRKAKQQNDSQND